jgi:hypothetical protein
MIEGKYFCRIQVVSMGCYLDVVVQLGMWVKESMGEKWRVTGVILVGKNFGRNRKDLHLKV